MQSSGLDDRPDLAFVEVELGAPNAYPGEQVEVRCVLENLGVDPAAKSRMRYYFSLNPVLNDFDTYRNYDNVERLSTGEQSAETANVRIPEDAEHGPAYILLVADYDRDVDEFDESNNVFAARIVVGDLSADTTGSGPNLVVENAMVESDEVRPGGSLPVSATVRNTGNDASGETYLRYLLSRDQIVDEDDPQLSSDKVDALSPGAASDEDAALRIRGNPGGGYWYVLFVVDRDDAVAESNESDNVVAGRFFMNVDRPDADLPDLQLESPSLDATSVTSGSTLTARSRVINAGAFASTEISRLKYFWSTDEHYDPEDQYINFDYVDPLGPGEGSDEDANLRVPVADPGDYFVLFVIDETDTVAETYESNNVWALPITLSSEEAPTSPEELDQPGAALPDLQALDVELAAAEVRAGERASLSLVLRNVSEHSAGSSRIKYYFSEDDRFDDSDAYLSYDSVPALAPGASSPESVEPRIPAETLHGMAYILVVVDANHEVEETYESNNVVAVPVLVVVDQPGLVAPDLAVRTSTVDRARVGANREVEVAIVAENVGPRASTESRIKYYLSSDARFDSRDVYLAYRDLDALGAGDSASVHARVRVPFGTASGDWFILVRMDALEMIEEPYESNNIHARPLSVGTDVLAEPTMPWECSDELTTSPALLDEDTVAVFNTLHLGFDNGKDIAALACVVSHFDLVGLVEIDFAHGLPDLEAAVEALTGESWSTHMSPYPVGDEHGTEYYGYIWRTEAATFLGSVGFYPNPGGIIKRPPYGANFRMGTFDFTFVTYHLRYGNRWEDRRIESVEMTAMFDYFQAQNGTESDVLFGGDFNLPADDPGFSGFLADGSIDFITDPDQLTSIGADALASSFDNIFFPAGEFSELGYSGVLDFTRGNHGTVREHVSDHIPVYVTVDIRQTDDD